MHSSNHPLMRSSHIISENIVVVYCQTPFLVQFLWLGFDFAYPCQKKNNTTKLKSVQIGEDLDMIFNVKIQVNEFSV